MPKLTNALARLSRWTAAPALALALLFSVSNLTSDTADAASRKSGYTSANYGHHTHKNQRARSIKPYKYERNTRYTYNSTHKPSSAPCSVVGTNPARWPASIKSCY